jgi:hypothetical protein
MLSLLRDNISFKLFIFPLSPYGAVSWVNRKILDNAALHYSFVLLDYTVLTHSVILTKRVCRQTTFICFLFLSFCKVRIPEQSWTWRAERSAAYLYLAARKTAQHDTYSYSHFMGCRISVCSNGASYFLGAQCHSGRESIHCAYWIMW